MTYNLKRNAALCREALLLVGCNMLDFVLNFKWLTQIPESLNTSASDVNQIQRKERTISTEQLNCDIPASYQGSYLT